MCWPTCPSKGLQRRCREAITNPKPSGRLYWAVAQHGPHQPGDATMPAITLPDGSQRLFDAPVTGTDVAAAIGPGLARAALAMKLDGKLVDLATPIETDANVVFVTRRDADALEMIRHDAAHVLAEAVQALYPGTQV